MIAELLTSQAAADMACALLHTLWQGLVVAVGLMVVLKCLPAVRSALRYRLSVVALLAVVVCWVGTFSILQYEAPAKQESTVATTPSREAMPKVDRKQPTASPERHATANVPATKAARNDLAVTATQNTPTVPVGELPAVSVEQPDSPAAASHAGVLGWVAVVWIVGVVVMLGRMFVLLCGTAKLKRSAVDIDEPQWVELFEQLCSEMGITRAVRFAATNLLTQPGVIGFFKPVLLVPVSILSEISVEDLRAILAHELAHIRRYDFLVNFCQMLIEALLFFNPGVWWISRRIRIEREACCDAAGVKAAGRPVKYAQILFEQIRRGAAAPANMAVAGFSDNDENASTERVSRIIHPQKSPRMKIGAVKLTLWLLIAVAVLAGLWKATNTAVAVTAKILTPAERIEKVTEIAKSHSNEYIAPQGHANLSGTIVTFDGKPIPEGTYVMILCHGAFTSSNNCGYPENGTFQGYIQCNRDIFVAAHAPGYAPVCTTVYQPDPNDVIDDIRLTLKKGFPTRIKIVDENERPISNAKIIKTTMVAPNESIPCRMQSTTEIISNQQGIAVLNNCVGMPSEVTIQAKGFVEVTEKKCRFRPYETTTITMERSLITQGRVTAQKTGRPVSNAVVKILNEQPIDRLSGGQGYNQHWSPEAARTDSNGYFTIDWLNPNSRYSFVVEAKGYNRTILPNVRVGQTDLKVPMPPERYLAGKIIGDLYKLERNYYTRKNATPHALQYRSEFTDKNYRVGNEYDHFPVTIRNGVGYFKLRNILGNKIVIQDKDHITLKTVYLTDNSIDDLVIDLDHPEDNTTMREVRIKFNTPAGYPKINGKMKLQYLWFNTKNGNNHSTSTIDIYDNVARFEVHAPNRLTLYHIGEVKGFWFDLDQEKEFNVEAGSVPFEIHVEAKPGGTIFGKISGLQKPVDKEITLAIEVAGVPEPYTNDKKRLEDFKVNLQQSFGRIRTKTGSFCLPSLPLDGRYVIFARDGNAWAAPVEPVKLTEANPIQEITLNFGANSQIKGRVLLPDKSPASGFPVLLYVTAEYKDKPSDYPTAFFTDSIKTLSDGTFSFNNINPEKPMVYYVRIQPDSGLQPLTVKISPDQSKTYRLKKGYSVRGKVVHVGTGLPIPDIFLFVSPAQDELPFMPFAHGSDQKTDQNGNFIFTTLDKKRYKLSGIEQQITIPSGPIEIVGGQTEKVELRVKPGIYGLPKSDKPTKN